MTLRDQIEPPYGNVDRDLPGLDFNRDIIDPGINDDHPNGVMLVRADDDFWVVGVFPYHFKDVDFRRIIEEFWPEYADRITVCPDSGSLEQEVYSYKRQCESLRRTEEHLNEDNTRLRKENARLRTARPTMVSGGTRTRHRWESDYFIKQYENLVTVFAHEGEAKEEPEVGVCRHCGLLLSDRVHSERFIARRAAGDFRIGGDAIPSQLPDDELFEAD